MKLGAMISYWTIKNMVNSTTGMYNDPQYEKDTSHHIGELMIGNELVNARILYRKDGEKIAFIYADIIFLNAHKLDEIFIKNASLGQIERHFIEN